MAHVILAETRWQQPGAVQDTAGRAFEVPSMPAVNLDSSPDRYEIALRAGGHRLVFGVEGQQLVVLTTGGKRAHNAVFKVSDGRS